MGIISRSGGGGSGIGALLFDSTLGADSGAGIDTGAAGIAQTQNVLEVFIIARTDEAAIGSTVLVTVNNDGGANYDNVPVVGASSTVTSAPTAAATAWTLRAHGNTGAGYPAIARLTIPGYTQTTFNKVAEVTNAMNDVAAAANNEIRINALGWRNTAAISRLKIVQGGGTVLRAGSRLLIYGR